MPRSGKTNAILEELSKVRTSGEPPERAYVERYLKHRNNCVVAAAAACVGTYALREHTDALIASYKRFTENAVKTDKGCVAKKAIAKALQKLEFQGAEWFAGGTKYTQFEPAYGGAVDTAVDLRCVCARALTAFPWFRASRPLVLLFGDQAPKARMSALDAVASFGGREAELLVLSKTVSGDATEEVMGTCFRALLSLNLDDNLDLVAGYLAQRSEAIAIEAALAIGESRAERGFAILHAAWEHSPSVQMRRSLLLAISTLRSDDAVALLRDLCDDPNYGDICRTALRVD
jgi:hypothetical protein